MRTRQHVLLGIGVAGVVLCGTAIANADGGTQQATVRDTIRFTTPWNGGTQKYIDLGKEGLGAGDMFLLTGGPMHSQGERIGTMEAIETILSGAHDGTISMEITLRLDGGNVMLEGIGRHDDEPFRLAVVGGTGQYNNARGQLTELGENEEHQVSISRLFIRR